MYVPPTFLSGSTPLGTMQFISLLSDVRRWLADVSRWNALRHSWQRQRRPVCREVGRRLVVRCGAAVLPEQPQRTLRDVRLQQTPPRNQTPATEQVDVENLERLPAGGHPHEDPSAPRRIARSCSQSALIRMASSNNNYCSPSAVIKVFSSTQRNPQAH